MRTFPTAPEPGTLIAPGDYNLLGTLEIIPGVATTYQVDALPRSASPRDYGYDGDTEVDWNSQFTATYPDGRVLLAVSVRVEHPELGWRSAYILAVAHDDAGTVMVVPRPTITATFPNPAPCLE